MKRLLTLSVAAVLLVGFVAPAIAQDEEEAQRLRQLEVFEQLLAETVQRHVSLHVDRALEVDNVTVDEEGNTVRGDALVVKAAAAPSAHGLYIADYGLLFSIQTPQVVVIPGALATRFEAPMVTSYSFREPEGEWKSATAVVEYRTGMMERTLADLEQLLEKEQAGEGDPERVAAMIADIERLRANLVELQEKASHEHNEVAEAPAVETQVQAQVKVRAPSREERGRNTFQFYRDVVRQQREFRDVMERNRTQLTAAINEAAVEALAQYGSVIKGLDSDERISILILPPTPMGPVRVMHENAGQEQVLSVRIKDIRDFDNQRIDLAEFRTRVTLHTRLGTRVKLSVQPER